MGGLQGWRPVCAVLVLAVVFCAPAPVLAQEEQPPDPPGETTPEDPPPEPPSEFVPPPPAPGDRTRGCERVVRV